MPAATSAAIVVGLLDAPFELDRLAARFLQDPGRIGHGGGAAQVKRRERHVDHDQRPLHGAAHDLRMVDDLVERHVQRVLVALHHHRQAVAHQHRVDAGFIEQRGKREIVSREHADLPAFGLEGREPGNRHAGSLSDMRSLVPAKRIGGPSPALLPSPAG